MTLPVSPNALNISGINTELGIARSNTLYEPYYGSSANAFYGAAIGSGNTYWMIDVLAGHYDIYWGGAGVALSQIPETATSLTTGGYTYYRGPFEFNQSEPGIENLNFYQVRRTSTVTQYNANPSGPGSNLKISAFYAYSVVSHHYVMPGDKGFPGGVATNVPASGSPLKWSNFHGMTRYFRLRQTVIETPATGVQLNASTELTQAGWNGTDPVDYILNVNSGATMWQASASPVINVSGLPRYSRVKINNTGIIQGRGGDGGPNGRYTVGTANPAGTGGAGSTAINVSHSWVETLVTIDNTGGTISGGGGGGGGGGAAYYNDGKSTYTGSGGGGGGGRGPSSGGAANAGSATYVSPGTAGTAGSRSAAGGGGAGGNNTTSGFPVTGGAGGAGGGAGAAGTAGTNGSTTAPGGQTINGAAGGASGNYLVGNSYTTFSVNGTRNGPSS